MWCDVFPCRIENFLAGGFHAIGNKKAAGLFHAEKHVRIDSKYFRPTEIDNLRADISKAKRVLNWTPRILFADLVKIMVDYDLELSGITAPGSGRKIVEAAGLDWIRMQEGKLPKLNLRSN